MKYVMTTLGGLALSAFSAVMFLACKGGGTDLTPDAQVARFCTDVVPRVCEAYFSCCDDSAKRVTLGKSAADCATTLLAECTKSLTDTLLPQIEAGNTALDEEQLATCVASLASMKAGGSTCEQPPLVAFQFDCLGAFQGTIAPGAACDGSGLGDETAFLPCADGLCQQGICQAFLATGDTCFTALKDPAAGPLCNFPKHEWCIGTGTKGHCGPRAGVGEACGVPGTHGTLACESTSCGANGKCATAGASDLCFFP